MPKYHTIEVDSIVDKAMQYAIRCHRKVNQKYGEHPYEFHLNMVNEGHHKFKYLLPAKDRQTVEAVLWCHDVIEDTGETFNDVAKHTSIEVAEGAFAMTNNKGRNRSERANKLYYRCLRVIKYGKYYKAIDRYANILNGYTTGHSMLKTQRKEHPKFVKELYDPNYHIIWVEMHDMLGFEGNFEPNLTVWDKLNRKLDKPVIWLVNKLSSF